VRQLCNGGLQGAFLGEGANVHFIDDELQEGWMTKTSSKRSRSTAAADNVGEGGTGRVC